MKNTLQERGFDQLDLAILRELQKNGRISVADLARQIHLSQPAVHNRIKRLEREGVIKQYVALLDREVAGFDLMCFISVSIQPQTNEHIKTLQEAITGMPEVLECFRVTGSFDLILKVAVQHHKALDEFIGSKLATLPGVDRTEASLVLNEIKSTTAFELK